MNKTLTVIVPAYNEETNIEGAGREILAAAQNANFEYYEILLFDDGSTDKTGEIIDRLSRENNHFKPVHNSPNRGFGYCCSKGVELARMNYISILPGDNEISDYSVKEMFKAVGNADIIAPFTMNVEVRPRSRVLISNTYIYIMNLLFRCDLHYYTGPAIHRKDLLKTMPLQITNFAFVSTVMVRLVRLGYSFVEVPMYIRNRTKGKSKAFRLGHIISVLWTIAKLFWEVEIAKRKKYSNFPVKRVLPYA